MRGRSPPPRKRGEREISAARFPLDRTCSKGAGDVRPFASHRTRNARRRRRYSATEREGLRSGPVRPHGLPHPRKGGPRSDAELRRARRHSAGRGQRHDADRHRDHAGAAAGAPDCRAGLSQPGHRRGAGEALARGGEGGRLDARHPGRRQALLRPHGFRLVPPGRITLPGPVDPARLLYCELEPGALERAQGEARGA